MGISPFFFLVIFCNQHTVQDDEVKRGGLVVEQPRQQDSAVKETRVRRSSVGDGERKGGQQREPTDTQDMVVIVTCPRGTAGDTVLEQKASSPVGLPVGHLTSSLVDHGVVAAKQRWFPSPPAHLVSTLEGCVHAARQHHLRPGHAHHCLRAVR